MIRKLLNFLLRLLGRRIAAHAPEIAKEINKGMDAVLPEPKTTVPTTVNQQTRKKQNIARRAANPKTR